MIVLIAIVKDTKHLVAVGCCQHGHQIVILRKIAGVISEHVVDKDEWQALCSTFKTFGDAKMQLYKCAKKHGHGLYDVKNGSITAIPIKDHGARAWLWRWTSALLSKRATLDGSDFFKPFL